MAIQTIALPALNEHILSNPDRIEWGIGQFRPQIIAALRPPGEANRYFRVCNFQANGRVTLDIDDAPSGGVTSGLDLSDGFEATGRWRVTTSQGSIEVALSGADMAEPYTFVPSNFAQVVAFYNAHTAGQQYAATLILADETIPPSGPQNMKYNGSDITAAKYNGSDITAAKYNGVTIF